MGTTQMVKVQAYATVRGRKLAVYLGQKWDGAKELPPTARFGSKDASKLKAFMIERGVESFVCSSSMDEPTKTATALFKMLDEACEALEVGYGT